jgi:N-acetylmuramoyl-L-alanine amidase
LQIETADKKQVRRAILRGVLEENLKIETSEPSSAPSSRSVKRKTGKAFPVAALFLLAGIFFAVAGIIPGQKPSLQVPNKPSPQLPWDEILFKQQLGTATDFATSWSAPVFDAGRLLKYNLLLNQKNVRLSTVFGLAVKTIVIDPGHGGKDPGAVGAKGTLEKDIVLDIALSLQAILRQRGGYNVVLTRNTDTFVSLADRVRFSNEQHADLFISLHINALPQKEYNVTETFYFGPPSDDYTLHLAEQENRGSQVRSGDFKNMIKKIGDVLKEQESARLASIIQYSLFTNMEKYDRILADNGIKIAPFVVLLGVDAPSVLVEISCISNNEEEVNLNNAEYRNKITLSLVQGINGYLIQRETQVVKGEDNDGKENKKNKG